MDPSGSEFFHFQIDSHDLKRYGAVDKLMSSHFNEET